MCHVEPSVVASGQLHGALGARQARFCRAYGRMERHVGVVAILLADAIHVGRNNVGVLTVGHDYETQPCCLRKQVVEGVVAVDEHVSCARAHEQCHARDAIAVELTKGVDVGIGSAVEETVVHVALLPQLEFVLKVFRRRRLR